MPSLSSQEQVQQAMPVGTAEGSGWFLTRNSLLNVLGQAIPLLVGVISIPLIVRGLGQARFGILALLWALVAFFTTPELGFGRAITKSAAGALSRDREDEIWPLLRTAALGQAALGLVGAIVLALVSPALVGALKVPRNLVSEATLAFTLFALAIPILLVSSSFRGVLEASQRFGIINAIRIPLYAGYFLVPLVAGLADWRLHRVVLGLVSIQALALGAQYVFCSRLFPGPRGGWDFRQTQFQELLHFSRWISITALISPVFAYLDRFLISALMSISAVAYYAAPYDMVTRLWIIPSAVVTAVFPAFTSLGVQGRKEALGLLATRSVRYLFLILGPLALIIIGLSEEIIRFWLGESFVPWSAALLRIFALGVLVNSPAHIPYVLIQSVGRPDVNAKIHFVELPLYCILSWMMISTWGLIGAAIAWLIRIIVDAIVMFVASTRLTHISLRLLWSERIIQMIMLLAFGSLAIMGTVIFAPDRRIMLLGVLVPLVIAIEWRFFLDDDERRRAILLFGAQDKLSAGAK